VHKVRLGFQILGDLTFSYEVGGCLHPNPQPETLLMDPRGCDISKVSSPGLRLKLEWWPLLR